MNRVSGGEFGLLDEGVDVLESAVDGAAQVGGILPIGGMIWAVPDLKTRA